MSYRRCEGLTTQRQDKLGNRGRQDSYQTAGKAKVKAGGIVGVTYGGSIMGCLNAVEMEVDSLVIDAGGIVGSLEGNSM